RHAKAHDEPAAGQPREPRRDPLLLGRLCTHPVLLLTFPDQAKIVGPCPAKNPISAFAPAQPIATAAEMTTIFTPTLPTPGRLLSAPKPHTISPAISTATAERMPMF